MPFFFPGLYIAGLMHQHILYLWIVCLCVWAAIVAEQSTSFVTAYSSQAGGRQAGSQQTFAYVAYVIVSRQPGTAQQAGAVTQ